MSVKISGSLSCPMPIMDHDSVQMAHGAGSQLSQDLIEKIFVSQFSNPILNRMEDHAVLQFGKQRLAVSTDSFVVDPIFFPGGDIGDLAVNGTVNDVAVSGGDPKYISAAFIIEEGFPMDSLHRITVSMSQAASRAGVSIVTGDTKVVDRGSCDKIFINTTGIGIVPDGVHISASNLKVGDKIILSGSIADHGMAILTSRESLSFKSEVLSDTAPLNGLINSLEKEFSSINAMRDPTRGGVAATLNEFAKTSNVGIQIFGDNIVVEPGTKGACEVLGIDPLYVANEGKLIAVVEPDKAEQIVRLMRKHEFGEKANIIGKVVKAHTGFVTMSTPIGANRIIDLPVGEQLPRIC